MTDEARRERGTTNSDSASSEVVARRERVARFLGYSRAQAYTYRHTRKGMERIALGWWGWVRPDWPVTREPERSTPNVFDGPDSLRREFIGAAVEWLIERQMNRELRVVELVKDSHALVLALHATLEAAGAPGYGEKP